MSKKAVLDTMAEGITQFTDEEYWMDVLSHEEWNEQFDYINEVTHDLMCILIKRSREEGK